MIRKAIKTVAIAFLIWLPFCVLSFLYSVSLSRDHIPTIFVGNLVTMGSAGVLGVAVWYVCLHMPWPLRFNLRFYALQVVIALFYAVTWMAAIYGIEALRGTSLRGGLAWPVLVRQLLLAFWFYAVSAGISYAIQMRNRVHEKETLAARAEALATAARLDALRARLNPHFLFNALHTLNALVKFRPAMAEGALQRLGDMLRYVLKEDGRELVEFSEEYDFTQQYLAFEQLRYEERLKVHVRVDPKAFNFDIPPFSLQTLVENAVRHAISVRPEGGSLWIEGSCDDRGLHMVIRDDGPGDAGDPAESHGFGLRSLRERLRAAYGQSCNLQVHRTQEGFEVGFVIPYSTEGAESAGAGTGG